MALHVSPLTRKAIGIAENLTSSKYDEPTAIRELEELYQEGIKLVVEELQHTRSKGDIFSSVMIGLDQAVASPYAQNREQLHRALSKTYRLFIEITWYRSWKQSNRAIWADTIKDILEHSAKASTGLSRYLALDIRFEYSVAKQAAKCLNPSESMWNKYIDSFFDLTGAAKDLSIADGWAGIKTLFENAQNDMTKNWYIDVYMMRWHSTQVITLKNFDKILEPELINCHKQGGKYSQCLVLIYKELLKNPAVNSDLKDRVFRGPSGLKDIILWEWRNTVADFFSHPKEVWRSIARKADRFWKTRYLAFQCLKELALATQDEGLKKEILSAVHSRIKELNDRQGRRFKMDKDAAKNTLRHLIEGSPPGTRHGPPSTKKIDHTEDIAKQNKEIQEIAVIENIHESYDKEEKEYIESLF